MNTSTITVRIDTSFSEDGKHRYLLRKIWDDKKPAALIISKSAGSDNGIIETTTQTIISNNLYALGYGGFCLCNLFSEIGGTETDDENNAVIKSLSGSKEFTDIIICWGNLSASKETVQEQAVYVEKILAGLKKKNIMAVSDGTNLNCHPLSPMVRKHFELIPYKIGAAEAEEVSA